MKKTDQFQNFLQYQGGFVNFYKAIQEDCVEVIEEHLKRIKINLNENFKNGSFIMDLPLIHAMKFHSYNSFITLLENGADMDAVCLKNNMSPFEHAKKNDEKAFSILKKFKNGEDIESFKTIPRTMK